MGLGFNSCNELWTRLRVSFDVYVSILCCYVCDSTGLDPATLDEMVLYYRLRAQVDGFRR